MHAAADWGVVIDGSVMLSIISTAVCKRLTTHFALTPPIHTEPTKQPVAHWQTAQSSQCPGEAEQCRGELSECSCTRLTCIVCLQYRLDQDLFGAPPFTFLSSLSGQHIHGRHFPAHCCSTDHSYTALTSLTTRTHPTPCKNDFMLSALLHERQKWRGGYQPGWLKVITDK